MEKARLFRIVGAGILTLVLINILLSVLILNQLLFLADFCPGQSVIESNGSELAIESPATDQPLGRAAEKTEYYWASDSHTGRWIFLALPVIGVVVFAASIYYLFALTRPETDKENTRSQA